MRAPVRTVLALVGLQSLLVTAAFADPPDPRPAVVVVAIAPTASELDGPKLRAAIGAELEADAVPEGDARAATARGRFDVSVDRAAGELVVSYVGGSEPLVRHLALPADAQAEARAVVAIAGNLGRDEAGDLAAKMRKTAPPVSPTPAANHADEAASERDELLLMRMLADGASRDRTERIATSLTFIGVGAGAIAVGSIDENRTGGQRVLSLVTPLGLPLVLVGVFGYPFADLDVGLTRRSRLERLSDYYPPGTETGRPWTRSQVEQMWKAKALEAHRERQGIAPVLIGLGAIQASLGGVFLVTSDRHDTLEAAMDVSAIAVGTGVAIWGIVASRGETDTEQRLHEYERAVGRSIVQDVGFRVVPASSGAVLSVTGRFD